MALITLKNVSFARDGRTILDNISLEVKTGLVTAVMGSSGSGKSTLLNLMVGRLNPDEGDIELFEQSLNKIDIHNRYLLWKRMGFLFQSAALFNEISVLENVLFPLKEHTSIPLNLLEDIALMKLEAVGLRAAASLYPHELSGGMQRRVALARALALDPQLVLYDEPFAGQDPISMGVLMRLIRQFNQNLKISSVLVSHDVAETLAIADQVLFLHSGKIRFHGSTRDFAVCQDPAVVQFVQGLPDGPVQFHKPTDLTLKEQLLCRS